MKKGFWHQFGDRSQKMSLELLGMGNGVGVIISPRDLSFENAKDYSESYRNLGADVLIDLQFYNPTFSNDLLVTYPINEFRQSMSTLHQLSSAELDIFADHLRVINGELHTSAVIAPSLVYEGGRNDIIEINSKLFSVAKKVGEDLGLPTYSTIMLGRSVTNSDSIVQDVLSSATALNSDGIYFGFEFDANRIPSDQSFITRFGESLLTLASTGKDILHSFAGPLSLLSIGFGATGVAVGHSHNLWQFSRQRWEPSTASGGGGDAPPRFFSTNLWGTIIYPDELIDSALPANLRNRLLTTTPFSNMLNITTAIPWDRWTANKHLLYAIGSTICQMSSLDTLRKRAQFAQNLLQNAVTLATKISRLNIQLKDDTCCYQQNWLNSVTNILANCSDDYDYISLLG
jgi:hypothetical protein